MPEFHQEQYIYLAGLTHKSALIAWGAFFFKIKGKSDDARFKLVDDNDLKRIHPPRHQTIGASSEPFGDAVVEVREALSGELAKVETASTANHVLVTGLLPDTEYTYKITVNNEEWAVGERRDWVARDDKSQGLEKSGRSYDNRFRTHPHPEISAPLNFAVLGDFGTGVRKPSSSKQRQREVAAALDQAVDAHKVRLVLTTGDNIYAGTKLFGVLPIGNTGDEDDDWFFTFYQPYRYIINRVPVYPAVGNHDSGETEKSDDRKQLMDNFFLSERFAGEEAGRLASLNPGVFYRFRFGSDFEFLCVDTSKASPLSGDRMFKNDKHLQFLESSLPNKDESTGPVWRIPFMHHPAYTAGPVHHNSRSTIDTLAPLFKRAGVHLVLSGHEHNFQHSSVDGISYFITGAGSKVSSKAPSRFDEAETTAWAAAAHFLLVEGTRAQMTITPIAETAGGKPLASISLKDAKNQPVAAPIIISSSGSLVLAHSGD
jgi:tartrate-resistant acid phosphatase type 5